MKFRRRKVIYPGEQAPESRRMRDNRRLRPSLLRRAEARGAEKMGASPNRDRDRGKGRVELDRVAGIAPRCQRRLKVEPL